MFICNTLSCPPKRLLRTLLQKTINSTKNSTIRFFLDLQQKDSHQNQGFVGQDKLFPIKRTRNNYPVRYISSIAHRIAASSTCSAPEIAEELTNQLLVYQSQQLKVFFDSALPVEILHGLVIQSTTAGYIQFDFSDQAIAGYLDLLLHSLPGSFEPSSPWLKLSNIPHWHHRIFTLQHTHARCCSLLRLAHQNRFIELNSEIPESQAGHWQITAPKPLLWLNASLQLHTSHTTELQLIAQIVTALDVLDNCRCNSLNSLTLTTSTEKDTLTLLSAAEGLSQAFHTNHQHWQLMGNLRTQGHDRLQAHLGLVLTTQRLLYHLLQEQLAIEAPFEL